MSKEREEGGDSSLEPGGGGWSLCISDGVLSGLLLKHPRGRVVGWGGWSACPTLSPPLVISSDLAPLPSWPLGTSVPLGKGPLSGLNSSAGYSGAGSPLLRPVPLLPFSNTSCGFLT